METIYPPIIMIAGLAGTGKGTQCDLLREEFPSIAHVSCGDVLRREKNDPTSKLGKTIADIIDGGNIVPASIMVTLLKEEFAKLTDASMILLDGFPRTFEQLESYEEIIKIKDCDFVVNFVASEDVCLSRLLHRGQSSGREDDDPEVIKVRFHAAKSQTFPVIEYLDKRSLTRDIDAAREPSEVYQDFKSCLMHLLKK